MSRLEQLMKFHEADPSDPFCTYGIALELVKSGRVEEALSWLEKTLAADADYAYAYYQKAKALIDSGRSAEAKATIDAGIKAAARTGDSHAAGELQTLGAML